VISALEVYMKDSILEIFKKKQITIQKFSKKRLKIDYSHR
jgi:hypothetical protein